MKSNAQPAYPRSFVQLPRARSWVPPSAAFALSTLSLNPSGAQAQSLTVLPMTELEAVTTPSPITTQPESDSFASVPLLENQSVLGGHSPLPVTLVDELPERAWSSTLVNHDKQLAKPSQILMPDDAVAEQGVPSHRLEQPLPMIAPSLMPEVDSEVDLEVEPEPRREISLAVRPDLRREGRIEEQPPLLGQPYPVTDSPTGVDSLATSSEVASSEATSSEVASSEVVNSLAVSEPPSVDYLNPAAVLTPIRSPVVSPARASQHNTSSPNFTKGPLLDSTADRREPERDELIEEFLARTVYANVAVDGEDSFAAEPASAEPPLPAEPSPAEPPLVAENIRSVGSISQLLPSSSYSDPSRSFMDIEEMDTDQPLLLGLPYPVTESHADSALLETNDYEGSVGGGLADLYHVEASIAASVDIGLERARALVMHRNFSSSIEANEQSLTDAPDNSLAQLELAQPRAQRAQLQSDRPLVEPVFSARPAQETTQIELAETFVEQGQLQSALDIYKALLRGAPDDLDALRGQAEVLVKMGEDVAAIFHYQTAIDRYPEESELKIALAQVYLSRQQTKQAIDILQSLSSQDTPQPDILQSLSSQENPQTQALLEEPTLIDRPDRPSLPDPVDESAASEIQLTFKNENNNSYTINQFINATARLRLDDQDGTQRQTAQVLRVGYNNFRQTGIEDITNIPIQVGLERELGDVTLSAGGGIDLFDRLPAAPNVFAEATWEVNPDLSLYGNVEYGAYKFNAGTVENEVRALRVTPSVFWQIDDNTSLYSSFTWGSYSDGNQEKQLFADLEHTFGDFFLGASLFYWGYSENTVNGYFAPDSFLYYEGEFGWDGQITDELGCRLSVGFGEKNFEGNTSLANTYKGRCEMEVGDQFEASLGYELSAGIEGGRLVGPEESVIVGELKFMF